MPIMSKPKSVLLLTAALWAGALSAQTAPAAKPSFLVVGTFHFEGSPSDLMGNSMPDVLSEKRQKQVEEVVTALARYKPTKIAVESPAGTTRAQERYQAYLDGKRPLGADETEQLAFRLAKRLGHTRIWPVDHKLDMDFEGLMGAAQKYGQTSYFDQAMVLAKGYVGGTQSRIEGEGLAAALRFMNDPQQFDAAHDAYLLMSQVGKEGDPKGAEVVGGWYQRNFYIFSNLVRLVESPEERVLLVIGAGHAKLLRDYIRSSPNLNFVETAGYLP
jgi:hypothetical protein